VSDEPRLAFRNDATNDGAVWWYLVDADHTLIIGVKNPRMEPDYDEDGHSWLNPEWDEIVIETTQGTPREVYRPLTDEEHDEYADDVRREITELCNRLGL
jgi:hypothetical protein